MKTFLFATLLALPLLTGCRHYGYRYVSYDHYDDCGPVVNTQVHTYSPHVDVVHVEEYCAPHVVYVPPVVVRPWVPLPVFRSPRIYFGHSYGGYRHHDGGHDWHGGHDHGHGHGGGGHHGH